VHIAAADAIVAGLQLGNHLDHQRIEVLAPADMLDQRPVFGIHRIPVRAVQLIGVEVLLLHAPAFIEDLGPLGARLDVEPQARGVERLGLEILLDLGYGQILVRLQQHMLAAGSDTERGHAAPDDAGLAVFEVEARQAEVRTAVLAGWLVAGAGLWCLDVEQAAVAGHLQRAVVAFGHRQADDALGQAVEIDLRGLCLVVLLLVLAIAFLVAVVVVGLDLLIAGLGRQRRLAVGGQHGGVQPGTVGAFLAGHVQAHLQRAGVGRSGEVQELAFRVESRRGDVGQAVGNPRGATGLEVVQHQVGMEVRLLQGVGQPAAVGRERNLEAGPTCLRCQPLDPTAVEFDGEQLEVVVAEHDPTAVGVPGPEAVEIRSERESARLALPGLVGHDQRLTRKRLFDPGNLVTLRRPQACIFAHARGLAQVAGRALVGRHREHLAAGGHDRTLAVGRDVDALNGACDRLPAWPQLLQVGIEFNCERLHAAVVQVERLDPAAGFIDDAATVA